MPTSRDPHRPARSTDRKAACAAGGPPRGGGAVLEPPDAGGGVFEPPGAGGGVFEPPGAGGGVFDPGGGCVEAILRVALAGVHSSPFLAACRRDPGPYPPA